MRGLGMRGLFKKITYHMRTNAVCVLRLQTPNLAATFVPLAIQAAAATDAIGQGQACTPMASPF